MESIFLGGVRIFKTHIPGNENPKYKVKFIKKSHMIKTEELSCSICIYQHFNKRVYYFWHFDYFMTIKFFMRFCFSYNNYNSDISKCGH